MKITRDDVKEVLHKWANGSIATHEVHAWASERHASKVFTLTDKEEEEKSITNEVLALLDCLVLNLVSSDDVPALIKLLETPQGQYKDGIFAWEDYLHSLDLEKRKEEIKKDSFIRAV